MVSEDFEGFFEGCGWREGGSMREGCGGVHDFVGVSWDPNLWGLNS